MTVKIKIPYNLPPRTGREPPFVEDAMLHHTMAGNGKYTKLCEQWFESHYKCEKALLVTSCTHALEIAAILLNIKQGDEVIMPSFTFVSTANAFVLRGATIVFVDVDPRSMNMDVTQLEPLITKNTKCIVPVHYAGVSCDMDKIMALAQKYKLKVVEDAAQCIGSFENDKPIGTRGHLSTFSFHETKNITSAGEGGMLLINDANLAPRAEIIREKGTNRSQFFRGEVDKYSWVDIGSSYLLGELNAAYLYAQLADLKSITDSRLNIWNHYFQSLKDVEFLTLPEFTVQKSHNAHVFYVKVSEPKKRPKIIAYLRKNGIEAVFHYVPLHSSIMGKKFGKTPHSMLNTERDSACLLRLPLHYGLTKNDYQYVCEILKAYTE